MRMAGWDCPAAKFSTLYGTLREHDKHIIGTVDKTGCDTKHVTNTSLCLRAKLQETLEDKIIYKSFCTPGRSMLYQRNIDTGTSCKTCTLEQTALISNGLECGFDESFNSFSSAPPCVAREAIRVDADAIVCRCLISNY